MKLIQKIKNTFWHLPKAIFFNYKYQHPSKKLVLIGVTGTDGKTTTATLLHQVLINAGYKCGLMSTIHAKIGDEIIDTGLHMTSPDSSLVQKILKRMVEAGMTHVVIEVTAHALDQYRFHGCNFEVSLITNTSWEHLDDFENITNYIRTKAKIFKLSKHGVVNQDDQSFEILKDMTTPYTTYSINSPSDYQAKDVCLSTDKLTFEVNSKTIATDSNYHYQVYNILSALAVTDYLNIDSKYLIDTVLHFPLTKGRREEIDNDFKFRTIIDFAHTPAALRDTLKSLKQNTPGNLIVIFGATGGRDKSKRPLMGEVVSRIADIAFITSDDTRQENIKDINAQIISGITHDNPNFRYFDVPNRQDAFDQAVAMAKSGDTIIACGKGHETTILHGTTEYPWSEAEAFRTAFRLRIANK